MKKLSILILTIFLFLFNTGCGQSTTLTETGIYFDTVVSITVYNETDRVLAKKALEDCAYYESLFSRTVEGSDVYRINHSGGEACTVNPLTADMIRLALDYCALTDGKIDITVAPLSDLWNFSENSAAAVPSLPDEEAIRFSLAQVDYKTVTVSGNTVSLGNPLAGIDLGFIAKGYMGGLIKETLTEGGVKSAIINLGGNITTVGMRPDGKPFNVGIKKPFSEGGEPIRMIPSSDQTISTCGVYERYFTVSDTRYHHILDTKTGYPIRSDILSVTCISQNAYDADALSTAFFVMGVSETMDYISHNPGYRAFFVMKDYSIIDSAMP